MRIDNDAWDGDRLSFAASALGQRANGVIDVYDGAVRLEVTLPWLLARFARAVQRVVGQRGQLMLGEEMTATSGHPRQAFLTQNDPGIRTSRG